MFKTLEGASRPTRRPPRSLHNRVLFSHRFSDLVFYRLFLDFDNPFGSILEHLSCFLHPFFEHGICIVFSLIFNEFSDHWFYENLILTLDSSSKTRIRRFRNCIGFSLILDLILALRLIDFSRNFLFFCNWFAHWFFIMLLMENASQMAPKKFSRGLPFWLPFRDLFRTSICWCILVALWLTFGTLWPPSGSLWVPVGSLPAHFWYLLAPFCTLLAPFGSLLASF